MCSTRIFTLQTLVWREGTLINTAELVSRQAVLSLSLSLSVSFACEDPGGRCSPVSARQRRTINANVRLSL